MKSGRRKSLAEDLSEIDAETMAQFYNSLSAEERREKNLPKSSRFKSSFTENQRAKILQAYNEDWESRDPLKLGTPEQKQYADMRRVVNMGEAGSTPGKTVGIPGRTGREQPFRKGSYDTLGTVPPLTEQERQGLMSAARRDKLPIMEEKAGGGASKSKSPVHTMDSSEFNDGISEQVYYYSETYKDWLNAELILEGDQVSLRILTPEGESKYIFGSLKDSSFIKKIKGKIYIINGRSYILHPIKDKL
jgi:hypothetical protein